MELREGMGVLLGCEGVDKKGTGSPANVMLPRGVGVLELMLLRSINVRAGAGTPVISDRSRAQNVVAVQTRGVNPSPCGPGFVRFA